MSQMDTICTQNVWKTQRTPYVEVSEGISTVPISFQAFNTTAELLQPENRQQTFQFIELNTTRILQLEPTNVSQK